MHKNAQDIICMDNIDIMETKTRRHAIGGSGAKTVKAKAKERLKVTVFSYAIQKNYPFPAEISNYFSAYHVL